MLLSTMCSHQIAVICGYSVSNNLPCMLLFLPLCLIVHEYYFPCHLSVFSLNFTIVLQHFLLLNLRSQPTRPYRINTRPYFSPAAPLYWRKIGLETRLVRPISQGIWISLSGTAGQSQMTSPTHKVNHDYAVLHMNLGTPAYLPGLNSPATVIHNHHKF